MPHPKLTAATPLQKTIWGSPAGKKQLAPLIATLIPAHKVYVEPFAGSGAVFFEKPPAETEVLSDADPEIAFAFRALAKLSDAELAILRKMDWVGRRKTYLALQTARPRTKVEKLYRFLYLSHFSYRKFRGRGYSPTAEGVTAKTIGRIEKFRARLRHVKVKAAHYADVIKEFDGKDTFFFLDPPYVGHDMLIGEDRFDENEFRQVLDGIQGKFLITYGARGQLDTSGLHVRKIQTTRLFHRVPGENSKILPQLLIANYAITEKALGPYALDEVEKTVDLSGAAAADLDHARALAKALAVEADEPRITALARELERIDGSGDERLASLAAELLPLANRLAPALKIALPRAASAFKKAAPLFEKLAKRQQSRAAEKARPVPAPKSAASRSVAMEKRIPLLKTDEERYVLGVVLEPDTVDAQQDIYSPTEVRDAAHKFMEEYRNVGLMHRDSVNGKVKILESYLAPVTFDLDGAQVRKGTWLLAVRVLDDSLWSQIKSGELTGFSIGGTAVRAAA